MRNKIKIPQKNITGLIDLPQMNDPEKLAAMRVFMNTSVNCYLTDPDLLVIIIEKLTIGSIIDAQDHYGSDNIPISENESSKKIYESLRAFGDVMRNSPANLPLKDI